MYTVHLLSYAQSQVPITSNDKAPEKEIQMHPVGSFLLIAHLSKMVFGSLTFHLFTLLVFFPMDGTFVTSSGTWKVMGAERRP